MRPQAEGYAELWFLHFGNDVVELEKVQRRALT